MEILTEKNFIQYCASNYNNPTCAGSEEFFEDLKRIKYIKKLITRYVETGDLKERLILNHIIVLSNVFNPIVLNRILFLKIESQFGYIKPFLLTVGMLSEYIVDVKSEHEVCTNNIIMDPGIVEALRKILPDKKHEDNRIKDRHI